MAQDQLNIVDYPTTYDDILVWPDVDVNSEVGDIVGAINRNRNALLTLENLLGLNPHIYGNKELDLNDNTVGKRLDNLERGVKEGLFVWRGITVRSNDNISGRDGEKGFIALKVNSTDGTFIIGDDTDQSSNHSLHEPLQVYKNVWMQYDLTLLGKFDVGRNGGDAGGSVIEGTSVENAENTTGSSVVAIFDRKHFEGDYSAYLLANPFPKNEAIALDVAGSVRIGGKLFLSGSLSHDDLRNIRIASDSTIQNSLTNTAEPLHVRRGTVHTHSKNWRNSSVSDEVKNKISEVEAEQVSKNRINYENDGGGFIKHIDLIGAGTRRATLFDDINAGTLDPLEAYHVTGGDEHDHTNGRGATIRHSSLYLDDSRHVDAGNAHSHSGAPGDGGGPISHYNLAHRGYYSHGDLDGFIDNTFTTHIERIDPDAIHTITPQGQMPDGTPYSALAGQAFHVPLGHVSDPSAHHERYTDEEAIEAVVTVEKATARYSLNGQFSIKNHIQALGNGKVTKNNPHGLAPKDINALEGVDANGTISDEFKEAMQVYYNDTYHGSMTSSDGVPIHDYASASIPYFQVAFEDGIIGGSTALSFSNTNRIGSTATISDLGENEALIIGGRKFGTGEVKVNNAGIFGPLTVGLDMSSFTAKGFYLVSVTATTYNGAPIAYISASTLNGSNLLEAIQNADKSISKGKTFPLFVLQVPSGATINSEYKVYDRRPWGVWRQSLSPSESTRKLYAIFDTQIRGKTIPKDEATSEKERKWYYCHTWTIHKPANASSLVIKWEQRGQVSMGSNDRCGYICFVLGGSKGESMEMIDVDIRRGPNTGEVYTPPVLNWFYIPSDGGSSKSEIVGGITGGIVLAGSRLRNRTESASYECTVDLCYCAPGPLNINLWSGFGSGTGITKVAEVQNVEMYWL